MKRLKRCTIMETRETVTGEIGRKITDIWSQNLQCTMHLPTQIQSLVFYVVFWSTEQKEIPVHHQM